MWKWGAILVTMMAACSEPSPPGVAPRPVTVEPSEAPAGVPVNVIVRGAFDPAVVVDFRSGASSLDTRFAAHLGTTPLDAVAWVDERTLTASVPALPFGDYELTVTGPRGREGSLPRAFRATCSEDRDGDGAFASACGGLDCDDDPSACGASCFPGNEAADVCDGHDQDCDGEVDEDPDLIVYVDNDGDGLGDVNRPVAACTAYAGTAAVAGDCLDLASTCTTTCVDEDLDGLLDCIDSCVDRDLDGLGDGTLGNNGCVATATDSDDRDRLRCADTDGDGCEDCRRGSWDPADDGLDTNGDGTCEPPLLVHDASEEILAATGTTLNVAVDVEPDRSVLMFNYTLASTAPADGHVSGQLAGDGSAVTFTRTNPGAVDVDLRWTVLELEHVRVLRGATTVPLSNPVATPTIQTLPATVDPARSFVLNSMRIGGTNYNATDWAKTVLADGDTLHLFCGGDNVAPTIEWQVVEIAPSGGAVVQHGEEVITAGTASAMVDLATPAPLERSFVVLSHVVTGSTNPPAIDDHALLGRLAGDSQLVFERGGTDFGFDIAWTVVTWDAVRAQHGVQSFAAGELTHTIPLAVVVDPTRSVAFLPSGGREGCSTWDTDDEVGEAWFAAELSGDGGQLTLIRGSALGSAEAAWTVLEL